MGIYGKRSKTNIDLDIRFFRRYPREIRFTLTIKDRIYEAKTVDYSLIGVGIIINDPDAPLNKGDLIGLDINELDLHEETKAAWVDEGPSGLRVGVQRIESFKGRFNIYPLPDILIGLQRTLKTGALEVHYRSLRKKLFIKNGNIIFAESNYEKDRLLDLLLKSRKINRRQYNKVEEMKRKSGNTHADILLHMGYIKPRDLTSALELQAKRILKSLFLMKDAEFELMEGLLSPIDPITLNLSVADFAYRELKKNADVALLESYLLDSVVDFSSDPLNLFQQIHFTTFDRTVISCVDGKRSIRDIINLSASVHRANPLKIICALLETRFLKISGKHESRTGIDANEIFENQRVKASTLSDEIEHFYSKYRDLDYYSMLGVGHSATAKEIKRAYYSAAKKYHPDKHFQLQKDAKTKLTEIFTFITNAYLTLINEQRRKDYEAYLLKEKAQKLPASQMPGLSAIQKDVHVREYEAGAQPYQSKFAQNHDIAQQRFRDGKTAFWDKHFDEAAHLFAAAIYFDPFVPAYHYYYGSTLLALGSPKKAVQALNKAYELNPLNADILAELGHSYLKLNFPLRAKGYFDKAAKLVPSNKRAMEGIQMLSKKKPR
jgi:curved DNA-binding protein CbpA